AAAVAHGVRTAVAAGCKTVVLTNGCGGLRDGMRPGQPVLISDHLNLTATSPIIGANFVDLTDLYSPRLRALCKEIDPSLEEGVYAQFPGPHYETRRRSAWPASSGPTWSACPRSSKRSPHARQAPRYWASPWSPTSPRA